MGRGTVQALPNYPSANSLHWFNSPLLSHDHGEKGSELIQFRRIPFSKPIKCDVLEGQNSGFYTLSDLCATRRFLYALAPRSEIGSKFQHRPFSSCLTLSKLLNLPQTQYPHLQDGHDDNSSLSSED